MVIQPILTLLPIVVSQHINLLISLLPPPHVVFCSNVPTVATGIHLPYRRSCAVFRMMGQANKPCKGYGDMDHYMAVTYEWADYGQQCQMWRNVQGTHEQSLRKEAVKIRPRVSRFCL